MRIQGVRAENLLSFDKLNLDLSTTPFTILVGPNGAGKTNLFRLINALLGLITHDEGQRGAEDVDWAESLAAWKRNPDRPAQIEIDVQWTYLSEGLVLANFFQMALAQREELWRTLAPSTNLPTSSPGWMQFVEVLSRAVSARGCQSAWSGTLGCRQTGLRDVVLYYRPKIARGQWLHLLKPNSGLCEALPGRLSSYSNPSLARVWIKSLPEDTQAAVLGMLQGDKMSQDLTLSLDWKALWDMAQTLAPAETIQIINTSIRNDDVSTAHPHWQELLRELEVEPFGRQAPTFERVLAYLLKRCIISEDLLSPPAYRYSKDAWWSQTKDLSSRHIAPYLLALKVGRDDERRRFASIQETFKQLSTHGIDATLEPVSHSDVAEVDITLVQTGDGSRSVPVRLSGSGSVEMTYLSAVLNSSNAHVLLLDEPGRSLHPQALIRLRQLLEDRAGDNLAPPIIVITHSPYLVAPSLPHNVRRVHRNPFTQCTEITQLPPATSSGASRRARKDSKKVVLQRQDRWGRSPNWPALLFSAAVLLVDGETELGALPEWYQQIYQEPLEAVGSTILSLGGKANGGAAIVDLDGFKIPWVMLIDGDSLKPGSGNVWAELKTAKRVTNNKANGFRHLEFDQQKESLKALNIYVMGESPDEQFEAVLRRCNPGVNPPNELGDSKVVRGRWWAQNVSCPLVIRNVFAMVRDVAMAQAGLADENVVRTVPTPYD